MRLFDRLPLINALRPWYQAFFDNVDAFVSDVLPKGQCFFEWEGASGLEQCMEDAGSSLAVCATAPLNPTSACLDDNQPIWHGSYSRRRCRALRRWSRNRISRRGGPRTMHSCQSASSLRPPQHLRPQCPLLPRLPRQLLYGQSRCLPCRMYLLGREGKLRASCKLLCLHIRTGTPTRVTGEDGLARSGTLCLALWWPLWWLLVPCMRAGLTHCRYAYAGN